MGFAPGDQPLAFKIFLMFKRELLNLGVVVAAIFILVAAAGSYLVAKLHQTSKLLAVDTFPGLVDAGLAEEQIYLDRRVLREMLFPHTAAYRAQMINSLAANHTAALWQDYATSIFEPEDRQNFQSMMLARSNYLAGEPRLFALVKAGRIPEATAWFYGDNREAFARYEADVRTLFEYNVQQGRDRAKILLAINRYVEWVIAIFGVMVLSLGLAVGFHLALGSSRRPAPGENLTGGGGCTAGGMNLNVKHKILNW
jgi:hypothetical protein